MLRVTCSSLLRCFHLQRHATDPRAGWLSRQTAALSASPSSCGTPLLTSYSQRLSETFSERNCRFLTIESQATPESAAGNSRRGMKLGGLSLQQHVVNQPHFIDPGGDGHHGLAGQHLPHGLHGATVHDRRVNHPHATPGAHEVRGLGHETVDVAHAAFHHVLRALQRL